MASSRDSGYSTPDISKVAEAYGLKTCRIHTNQELDEMLPKLLENEEMLLCEVFTDPDECVSPRVKAKVCENGAMIAGKLDEMWPFID